MTSFSKASSDEGHAQDNIKKQFNFKNKHKVKKYQQKVAQIYKLDNRPH